MAVTVIVSALIVGCVSGYGDYSGHGKPGFSVLPPPRTTRQTAGPGFICVPSGTCVNPNNTNVIDPRIVTPGTAPPSVCPAGQIQCECGQRYVPITDANGPSMNGAFPWQAYLEFGGQYNGSGVLVDPLHVVTAAHKVQPFLANPQAVTVKMGVWNNANDPNIQTRTAAAIRVHEQYARATLKDDIAIIRLNSPIVIGRTPNVAVACFPPAATSSYVGQSCIVSGWGVTSFGANDAPTVRQKQVTVPIVSYATCRTSMMQPNVLGSNTDTYLDTGGKEICAGGEANMDACTQDGGSPLVCRGADGIFRVAGLVIWGKNCGQPGVYGVYVSIPAYLPWIRRTIASMG